MEDLRVGNVLAALPVFDLDFDTAKIARCEMKKTLILTGNSDMTYLDFESAVKDLSDALKQDYITVYFPDFDFGALIGGRSGDWGTFNKQYFLQ